jgi:hypothetical protein
LGRPEAALFSPRLRADEDSRTSPALLFLPRTAESHPILALSLRTNYNASLISDPSSSSIPGRRIMTRSHGFERNVLRRLANVLFCALAVSEPLPTVRAQSPAIIPSPFEFKQIDDKSLGLWEGDRPVLAYNHGEIPFQAGRRTRTRASYFHPIYGLDGEVLTDNAPADHFHHHGLFWAWTHVWIAGREYNFWEGDDIRIRFQRWHAKETSGNKARLGVENGWFLGAELVMKEELWLEVDSAAADARNLDIAITWTPTTQAITLAGAADKSYGGFSLRFAPRRNTVITVPSGQASEDLLVTKLPWADLSAQFADAATPSGAAVFVHPSHPGFPPEWMTREYGLLAVGWPGVNPKTLPPGQHVTCRYRVWIHRGTPDATAIQNAFDHFGNNTTQAR